MNIYAVYIQHREVCQELTFYLCTFQAILPTRGGLERTPNIPDWNVKADETNSAQDW
jgi:hypothetical protein